MIPERIVVSDANILFDILSVNLLDSFVKLPAEILTTEMVVNEIKTPVFKEQMDTVIHSGEIEVVTFSFEEMWAINSIKQFEGTGGLSFADCSVLYLAEERKGRLLTGDRHLKLFSEKRGIPVSGILYVLDCLATQNIISRKEAVDDLTKLVEINPRLPKKECEEMIAKWRDSM